jgi:hypothetical protein
MRRLSVLVLDAIGALVLRTCLLMPFALFAIGLLRQKIR